MISLLLVAWSLLPSPLLYISAFFERNTGEYYDRLMRVSQEGDWKGWLQFFLRGVEEQSQDAISSARRLQDLQMEWRDKLTTARASALQLRLLDHLFEMPVLTIPIAARILGVTYASAKRNIEKLTDAGVLKG